MTTVTGTFAYCGFNEDVALDLTCTGPACDALKDFPDTNCTTTSNSTASSIVHCTNGIECATNLWVTDLNFQLADAPNALVQQHHTTTVTECNYKFEVVANGKPSDFVFRNITAADPKCLVPVGVSSNSTGNATFTGPPSNSTGNSTIPSAGKPSSSTVTTSGAPCRFKVSYLLVLAVFFGFFLPTLADELDTRGITPAKPPASLFPTTPEESWCVQRGFAPKALKARKRAIEARVSEYGQHTGLEERDIGELATKLKDFAIDRLTGWMGAKAWSFLRSSNPFKECLKSEMTSSVCAAAWDVVFSRIGIIGEMVPACMTIVEGFALADAEPFSRLALTIYAGTLCNWLVAEAIPIIPCFEEWYCDSFQNLFPATKCEGSPPPSDATTLPKKNVPAVEYRSGGSLLTNPGKCGAFFNQCASGKCENAACTKAACVGKTCNTFEPCGPGNGCVCGTIQDSSSGFCVYGLTPCAGLKDCTKSAQCGAGEVCIQSSCCGRSVCVGPGGCEGSTGSQRRSFNGNWDVDTLLRRGWVNATIAMQGHWE